MPSIRELAEKLWNGEIDTQEYHPVSFRQTVGEEIADGVLYYKGIDSAELRRASLLFSPQTLVQGMQAWLFDKRLDQFGEGLNIGSFGSVYALAWLVFTGGSVLLLLLRYKKVAR